MLALMSYRPYTPLILVLLAVVFAWDAMADDAASRPRRQRSRQYDGQIQLHGTTPAVTTPAEEENALRTKDLDSTVPDTLEQQPFSRPPSYIAPPPGAAKPREREKDEADDWEAPTIEGILGTEASKSKPSGWGWLADEIQAKKVDATEANDTRREEDEEDERNNPTSGEEETDQARDTGQSLEGDKPVDFIGFKPADATLDSMSRTNASGVGEATREDPLSLWTSMYGEEAAARAPTETERAIGVNVERDDRDYTKSDLPGMGEMESRITAASRVSDEDLEKYAREEAAKRPLFEAQSGSPSFSPSILSATSMDRESQWSSRSVGQATPVGEASFSVIGDSSYQSQIPNASGGGAISSIVGPSSSSSAGGLLRQPSTPGVSSALDKPAIGGSMYR